MPPKSRKSGEDEYKPSDSEDSDSPAEHVSRPLRGRRKKKSTESLSVHSTTSQHSHHSKSASRTSSYASSSAQGSRTNSKGRPNVSVKVARKSTRRKARRQNTFVKQTAATVGEMKKKIVPKILVRNPTHKVVKIPKKNVDNKMLAPPQLKPKKTKKKKKDNADKPSSDDELMTKLAELPLPSSSIPHVYNKNISLIGSINIQAFGDKKWNNHVIMRIIADILMRYDIVLCQEVHIPKGKEDIMHQLAELVSTPATPYSYIASDPLGRNSYQERYLYLYRKNEWKVLDNYVIDDDEKFGDKFIRDPYVVRFQHLRKPNVRVTLVGCHTQPEKAFDEIKVLVSDVYVNVKNKLHRDTVQEKRQHRSIQEEKAKKENHRGFFSYLWYLIRCCPPYSSVSTRDATEEIDELPPPTSDEPIVLMGDFNASGSYVNKKQRAELDEVLQKNKLMWGIQHSSDTTVADGTNCAYDRFVFEAANERKWVGNSRVWRFDEGWENQSNDKPLIKKVAKRVTDHYPIEFELKI